MPQSPSTDSVSFPPLKAGAPWRIIRCVNHIGLALDRHTLLDHLRRALRTFRNPCRARRPADPIPTLAPKSQRHLQKLPERALAAIKTQTPTFKMAIYVLAVELSDILKSV
jgi:hypothetical protein